MIAITFPSTHVSFFYYYDGDHRDLHSFPTRRSSDLVLSWTAMRWAMTLASLAALGLSMWLVFGALGYRDRPAVRLGDRKSTRLNSSHVEISYAVFCLKKKRTWVR